MKNKSPKEIFELIERLKEEIKAKEETLKELKHSIELTNKAIVDTRQQIAHVRSSSKKL